MKNLIKFCLFAQIIHNNLLYNSTTQLNNLLILVEIESQVSSECFVSKAGLRDNGRYSRITICPSPTTSFAIT